MSYRYTTRRSVLRSIGLGVLATGFADTSGAEPRPGEKQVLGTESNYGVNIARERAESVETELEFGDLGCAMVGRFSDDLADELEAEGELRYHESDPEVHILDQSASWGCERVGGRAAHAAGNTGDGAHIAVLDTGIDSDHPDLEANLGEGYAVESCEGDCDYEWDDDHDHGTHCAGIADAVDNGRGVVGVSTEATLHAVKVIGAEGSGSASSVAEGIKWAADRGHDVVNMSIGGSSGSSVIADAVQYAHDRGVLLVASAGNEGPCSDCVHYPAAYPEVIAVGSVTDDDELSEFSSQGPEVGLVAPGSGIRSTVRGEYDVFSGTSMAAPHVAGAGALLAAQGLSNREIRDRLADTAEDVGLGRNRAGAGLLDAAAAVDAGDDGDDGDDGDGGNEFGVTTQRPTEISSSAATLGGELSGLGEHDSATVGVRYWIEGRKEETVQRVESGERSSPGEYTVEIDGLEADTTYVSAAFARAGSEAATGAHRAFTTAGGDEAAITVVTDEPTEIEEDEATLNGRVTEMNGVEEVEPVFDYWVEGRKDETLDDEDAWDLESPGAFEEDANFLEPDTTYVVVARAVADDGPEASGDPVEFTTATD